MKYFFTFATIAGSCVAGPSLADAQSLGRLVKVSGGTPFKHCTADQEASQPGTNNTASAVEPWIAADPTTAGHLITATQQDRWTNGGSRGLQAGISYNSGKTWVKNQPPGVSLCTGGRLQRSTDPWSSVDLNGTVYFFSLAFNNNPSPLVNGESAQLVSRSLDGGMTWQAPVAVIDDTDPLAFNDKNSLTADPTQPGYVYTVWDRLYGPPIAFKDPFGSDEHSNNAAAQVESGIDGARHRVHAAHAAAAAGQAVNFNDFFGPAYFARSTDSGQTFERAVPIYDPGKGEQTIGNVIVGLPDGSLRNFFTHIDRQANLTIESIRSNDHGFSWTPHPILVTPFSGADAVTPDTRQPIRQADIIFSANADQNTGNLYVVWEDKPAFSPNLERILFTQSTDGGATWSTPIRIDQTPKDNAVALRGEAFNGTVVAGGNGTLVATYYDFRNDTGVGGEFADVWAVFCQAGSDCSKAKNWGHELRLTDTSFNILDAPVTDSGYFLGDYFGLVSQGNTVWPAFTATNGKPGESNLYTRAINLAGVTPAAR